MSDPTWKYHWRIDYSKCATCGTLRPNELLDTTVYPLPPEMPIAIHKCKDDEFCQQKEGRRIQPIGT